MGLFLGRSEAKDELLAGTENGIYQVRNMKRLVIQDHTDIRLLEGLEGTPWDAKRGAMPGRSVGPTNRPVVPLSIGEQPRQAGQAA